MPRRPSRYPTELELEILKVLWRDGPSSVRHVRKALVNFRKLAHNSVMTIMSIMTQKGYLKRAKKGNYYIYRPRVSQEQISSGIINDIVQRVFEGSAVTAVVNLLETGDINKNELAELRKLIRQKSKEAQK